MPTALSLLAWYVFAPQCLSTLATVKRETNSWRYPLIMAAYMFALAYAASFITYRAALALHYADLGEMDDARHEFETLAKEGINIEMISTSPIRISCVVRSDQGEQAVRALHQAFDLERS